jgi:hypothetical protein
MKETWDNYYKYNEYTCLLKNEYSYYKIRCFNCKKPMYLTGFAHCNGFPDMSIFSCKKCENKVQVELIY